MVRVYIATIGKLKKKEFFSEKFLEVSEIRQKKIEACKVQKDKERSLAAELLLQKAWKDYQESVEPKVPEYEIAYLENGKPVCMNDERFHFNLSHSGAYVVCAAADTKTGVDIQKKKQAKVNIAKRFFQREEYEELEMCNKEEQATLFCEMWCMKESYIKYTGLGMQQSLNSFRVDRKENKIIDLYTDSSYKAYLWKEIPEYVIAVCVQREKIQKELIWCEL